MDDSLDDKWMVRVRLELEDKIKERREEREGRGERRDERRRNESDQFLSNINIKPYNKYPLMNKKGKSIY